MLASRARLFCRRRPVTARELRTWYWGLRACMAARLLHGSGRWRIRRGLMCCRQRFAGYIQGLLPACLRVACGWRHAAFGALAAVVPALITSPCFALAPVFGAFDPRGLVGRLVRYCSSSP